MAKWDVATIHAAMRCADGQRINWDITGDPDGNGLIRCTYTWHPDENVATMANNIYALFLRKPVEIKDYVPPTVTKQMLLTRLSQRLREINLAGYTERAISTENEEPIPQSVKDAARYARAIYNGFKEALPNVPVDWESEKYWAISVTTNEPASAT